MPVCLCLYNSRAPASLGAQVQICGLTGGMEALLRSARSKPEALAVLQTVSQNPAALNALKDAVDGGFRQASQNATDPQAVALLKRLVELGLVDDS